jgi:hypothetical protein
VSCRVAPPVDLGDEVGRHLPGTVRVTRYGLDHDAGPGLDQVGGRVEWAEGRHQRLGPLGIAGQRSGYGAGLGGDGPTKRIGTPEVVCVVGADGPIELAWLRSATSCHALTQPAQSREPERRAASRPRCR